MKTLPISIGVLPQQPQTQFKNKNRLTQSFGIVKIDYTRKSEDLILSLYKPNLGEPKKIFSAIEKFKTKNISSPFVCVKLDGLEVDSKSKFLMMEATDIAGNTCFSSTVELTAKPIKKELAKIMPAVRKMNKSKAKEPDIFA